MATQIELLTSLQLLDEALRQKVLDAEATARQGQALEEAVRERAAEADRIRAELDAASARQQALERELGEVAARVKDRRMRLNRIRNEKELQATRREIDVLRERNERLEEEGIGVLEQVETLSAKLRAAEEALHAFQHTLESEGAALAAHSSELAADIARDTAARQEVAARLDEELRRRYELISSRRGGTAVVELRDGTCRGCHMNVPPQLYNEIQKNQQVFACPSCHRLLYWRPEGREAKGP